MINTIISGFLDISIHILDFFLAPIEQLLFSSGFGDNVVSLANNFNSLMTVLRGVLPWVIDATGVPKPIFIILFATVLAGIGLRLSVLVLKIVVKWWDRIVA